MASETSERTFKRLIGRYALYGEIASGGMATVHFGRLLGPVGFSRTVAIKTLHPQFARDPDFVAMFLDEARLAARIRHPNVVQTLDVVATDDELVLVMDYVQGESLSRLIRGSRRRGVKIPPKIAVTIVASVLQGLHAAHEAKNERGEALGLVHRDVSPHNVLVGTDGVARVLDFGVAKAAGRVQTTRDGQLKGKLAYMAPEQVRGGQVDRRTDVYAASIVLWEALTCRRLFEGEGDAEVFGKVLEAVVAAPSTVVAGIPRMLDAVVLRGLERDPDKRFQTAKEMAKALERTIPFATPSVIGEWVDETAGDVLTKRADLVAEMESHSDVSLETLAAAAQASAARASQAEIVLPTAAPAPDDDPLDDAPTIASDPSKNMVSVPSMQMQSGSGISSSQLSNIAVATPAPARARTHLGSTLKIVIAVAGGAALASLVGLVALRMSRSTNRTSSSAGPQPSARATTKAAINAAPSATATESAQPAESATDTAVAASALPLETAAPTPKRRAAPKPHHAAARNPPPTHVAHRAKPAPTHAPAPKPAPKAKTDCNPPYTIDSGGIKHFKPQCL